MSESPRETYRRLAALATDPATTEPERESALALMARYLAKYGEAVLIPETEPEVEGSVSYASVHEGRLAGHCAIFAGATLVDLQGRKARRGRRSDFAPDARQLVFCGAESAVAAAVELYARHRPVLARLLDVAENGYRHAAMPLPPAERCAAPASVPLSDAMKQALQAAQSEGAAQGRSKRLGPRR